MTEYERIREVVKNLDPERCGLDLNAQVALGAEVQEAGIAEVVQTAFLYGYQMGKEPPHE
mgnify:CR=1 FL=1